MCNVCARTRMPVCLQETLLLLHLLAYKRQLDQPLPGENAKLLYIYSSTG